MLREHKEVNQGRTKFSENPRIYLKILGVKKVIRSKHGTKHPQLLGATVKNLLARANWRPDLCNPDVYDITSSKLVISTWTDNV